MPVNTHFALNTKSVGQTQCSFSQGLKQQPVGDKQQEQETKVAAAPFLGNRASATATNRKMGKAPKTPNQRRIQRPNPSSNQSFNINTNSKRQMLNPSLVGNHHDQTADQLHTVQTLSNHIIPVPGIRAPQEHI
ncbi:hypothetical protein Nepgr_002661 [Nepenthes gracilis]|uniref:Uncharacterized protein n=1 Tax=Nepenthes gracilis TaxID=150966 RepID=A0AAD3P7G5_NEPGR|nr:hypothetical protein Nepgr_002661 [Nepenthes gracilis]